MSGGSYIDGCNSPYPVRKRCSDEDPDGIALLTDIYRPAAEGKYPVLIERTPYDKGSGSSGLEVRLASQGYVVIVQDTRGRYEATRAGFFPPPSLDRPG